MVPEAVFGGHLFVEQPAAVGHPRVVHLVVAARGDAVDDALATPNLGVHAGGGFRANAGRGLQEPHAHLEAEIGAGKRTDRADVDGVERIVVLELPARVAGERGVAAAVDKAEHVVAGDLLAEADAARTEDATLVVEHDARAEPRALGFDVLPFGEARIAAAVAGGLLLQLALASLVADRAVERVVDEEEFHHAFAAIPHQRRAGADVQTGRGVGEARDGGLRHPVDFYAPGRRIHDRLFRGVIQRRRARLDQAHAAVAGDTQLGMIAEMRNLDAQQPRGLNHVRAFRHGDLPAVDVDGDEVGFGRGDHGEKLN